MEIGYVINEYLARLGCTAKALATASGISAIQISRWRNGSRKPSQEMMIRLAAGISALSEGAIPEAEALRTLQAAVPPRERARSGIGERIDLLLGTLHVRTSEVARVLNFDPSYLSRIRSGKRNPANTEPIAEGVSRFLVRRCSSDTERAVVAELIGVDAEKLNDSETYVTELSAWLRGGSLLHPDHSADVSALLQALDSFDLNEYIRAMRIDDRRPGGSAAHMPEGRSVSGLKNMMRIEMDFFHAAAISESSEPVFIYTDMPLTELAKDPDYPKQWMTGVARLIKKGLRVEMIHNVNRPFEELLLGLEVHIPIYMTGRIAPYYLRESSAGPFRHLLEVSGEAALSGEAITGHHTEGRYTLVTDPEQVQYYRRRAAALMEKAAPLMDIYTEEQAPDFERFLEEEAERGYAPVTVDMPAFQNVTVRVCHDRWAIVSKDHAPRIDFVIRHPRLVDAIERFAAPLVD